MSPARTPPTRPAAAVPLNYVLAWIVGLLATPAAPSGGSAAELNAYIADHRLDTVAQSLLVRGAAGAALAVPAVVLRRLAAPRARGRGCPRRRGRHHRSSAVLGLGDAALRHAIDLVDGAKLLALAVSTVAATVPAGRTGLGRRWLTVLAWTVALLLLPGAASFVARTSP